MPSNCILVVDDEERVLRSVMAILADEGYRVSGATSGDRALDWLQKNPADIVFLDISMPGTDGVEVLRRVRDLADPPEVVMVSAHGNIEVAVRCTKLGAFDFLEKPLSLDRLLVIARNAIAQRRLARANELLRGEQDLTHQIIGRSAAIKDLLAALRRAAPTQARILVTGENGSGKELVARAIHAASRRASGPFTAVNCAAIPDDLIESELFGHEKGAFTGAESLRKGKFEVADGGTLFLDEVGDMSLRTQAKVLRALEENTIQRIGGGEPIPVDVRVIAASNKDLPELIRQGGFREDLYYRLRVIPLHIPPVRERPEDIPVLADYYLALNCRENKVPLMRLAPDAVAALVGYRWPGNVRELRNLMEFLVIMSPGETVAAADLPDWFFSGTLANVSGLTLAPLGAEANGRARGNGDEPSGRVNLREARDQWERRFILEHLIRNEGNIKKTADELGIERSNLHRKIRAYGIDVDALRDDS